MQRDGGYRGGRYAAGVGFPQPMPQEMPGMAQPTITQVMPDQMPQPMGATRPEAAKRPKIGKEQLKKANDTLRRYKAGKAAQDARVVEDEKWYRMRHWELMRVNDGEEENRYQTRSAWLFNALNILHSDAMSSYPRINVLPREKGDKEEAMRLSSILPVVMQQNDFKSVYDKNTWKKGRSGTAVYGIFWDQSKLNSLGDISLKAIDILNVYWQPGKDDIQDSRNLFHVEMLDKEQVQERWGDKLSKGSRSLNGQDFKPREYDGEDNDTQKGDRVAVIDWYYKKWNGQKKVLHYVKYVGLDVLYASENDEELAERGWFDHGEYPFVVDAFYPVESSPAGFGLIDVNKSAQEQIDAMNSAIVSNTMMRSYPRYFEREDGGINEKEFTDWSKPVVKVASMDVANDVQPIQVPELPAICVNVLNNKIEELRSTSGSTDVANGEKASGVTAYSAIAALIETSGKNTKSFSMGSYRAVQKIGMQVIELIRQFYDLPRQFRIVGDKGQEEFVQYDNAGLQQQLMPGMMGGEDMYRLPVFDLTISAEKESTYTRLAQNEFAKELLGAGVFNPQMVDQSLMMLDMMDFDGKEELIQKLEQMGTMQQRLVQFEQLALSLAQKYAPELAEQIAQAITGNIPQGAAGNLVAADNKTDAVTGVSMKEHPNGAKARGVVDNATMPQ